MLFKNNKIEEPKNPLGYALYKYDNIISKDLAYVIKSIKTGKYLKKSKADLIIKRSMEKLSYISESISKDNLKIDYNSDKARNDIEQLISDLKTILEKLYKNNYVHDDPFFKNNIDSIYILRHSLKKKLKDIGSDYL